MAQSTSIQKQLTRGEVNTLVQAGIIPANTPDDQIRVFAQICKERGLSPFSKEIHLVGYGNNYSVIVGINGFRKIAAETGQLAGVDDAKFNLTSDGKYFTAAELKAQNKLPISATVTVYRLMGGVRCPFTHTAIFSEFSSGKQKWQSMPFQMIAKVAEAFALRKGFSDRLTGLDVDAEGAAYQDAQAGNTELEKAVQRANYMIDQARMDDQTLQSISVSLSNCETPTDVYRVIEIIANYLPENDPAKQFGNTENATSGTSRRVSTPTKNQF